MLDVGQSLPDLPLDLGEGGRTSIAAYGDRPLVIYFYPKDDTSGCTKEAQAFTALLPEFEKLNVTVIGVSKDSAASHAKFAQKYALGIALAADVDGAVCEAFGVWVPKSMYGRNYMGIERATFLIDANVRVAQVWRKVKVAGHAEAVLAAARALV